MVPSWCYNFRSILLTTRWHKNCCEYATCLTTKSRIKSNFSSYINTVKLNFAFAPLSFLLADLFKFSKFLTQFKKQLECQMCLRNVCLFTFLIFSFSLKFPRSIQECQSWQYELRTQIENPKALKYRINTAVEDTIVDSNIFKHYRAFNFSIFSHPL